MKELILQITKFPGAESIHMAQGFVAGWLLVQGYIHRCLVRVVIAVLVMITFAIYETLEMFRIADKGDIDFQVALICMWLSGCLTLAYHLIRKERS